MKEGKLDAEELRARWVFWRGEWLVWQVMGELDVLVRRANCEVEQGRLGGWLAHRLLAWAHPAFPLAPGHLVTTTHTTPRDTTTRQGGGVAPHAPHHHPLAHCTHTHTHTPLQAQGRHRSPAGKEECGSGAAGRAGPSGGQGVCAWRLYVYD